MLCYDGQLRNVSVATHFIHFSSTAMSNATSEYVTVPERRSRNEEPTSRNEGKTRNVPNSYLVLPQNLFNKVVFILFVLEHEILSHLAIYFIFTVSD